MSCSGPGDLDLQRDLPTDARDVRALHNHRPAPMSLQDYIAFLDRLPQVTVDELRARGITPGPPFELLP